MVSDNGTQFTSSQFQDFCRQNAINRIFSPPYHLQSNGQTERFVYTFKRALLEAREEGASSDIIQRFLLVYQTTLNDSLPGGQFPVEALMGRKLRTVHTALIPNFLSRNTPAKKMTALDVGTRVYVQGHRPGNNPWKDGYILKQIGNVMYDVQVSQDIWTGHLNRIGPSMTPMNDKN